ncbi:MFS multidrug transporter [Pochonia chlamydosporia 170]|uniref:MFS multidrug transporter n=1 Tax=Pochonia chlamydosporia 170 TaxID=1380566 RepID=A0A179FQL4_METCM|nr:MFS multidrug transporter [Pochonia chlamydosporia 170]OAQ67906.1 MFS multidrug transporter [Pochonia chlamydosporia 170]
MATHALQDPIPAHLPIAEYLDKKFRLSALPTLEFAIARDEVFSASLRGNSTSSESLIRDYDSKEKEDVEDDYVTGWKLFSLMVAITLASFLVLLDMSIIVTAIPRITTYFQSLHDVGWYGAAYNLSSAALQPLSGKFYTYFRTKWIFLSFLLLFQIGSLICGIASSSTMFILGRAVAGLGSAGLQNGAFTIIVAAAPLEKRPALMGMVMGGCQIGLVAGPLVGGALTEYTTWRWCFYINFPIGGLAALVIALVSIPDRRVRIPGGTWDIIRSRFDLPGFVLFAPWAIMILLAVEYGGITYPWNSPIVIGLLAGGVATLVLFVYWEKRVGENAMIPLSIIRKREIWTACLLMVFLFTALFGASYYLPIYFQSIKGASPFLSGVYILPSLITQLVFAVISGFLVQKMGYYLPFAVASGAIVAIGSGLLATLDPFTPTAKWVGYQIFVGAGRGLGMQIALIAIQANTPSPLVAIATATMVFCQTFSGAMFIAVANTLFNSTLKKELTRRIPSMDADEIIRAGATGVRTVVREELLPAAEMSYAKGFQSVFYLVIALAGCMFFVAWGIGWKDIRKKKRDQKERREV